MFKKLFGSKKEDIDLSFGYERLVEFKDHLTAGNYDQFETTYETLTWDAQTLLNEGIGLNVDCAPMIAQWVLQRPDSYIARLFAGTSNTSLAWKARGAATASNVSDENANKFIELLDEAAAHLLRSDELNPHHPETGARIIRAYMGLGAGEEAVTSFFDAAVEVEPAHLLAHLMMINYLNPKWGGSAENMQRFARERMEDAGNSLLVVLPLFAITEEWIYAGMMDDNKKFNNFFKDPAIKTTVENFYHNYREDAEGSLLVPYVYNYFGFLFWQLGNKVLARECIKKIQGKMTVYPWAYMEISSNEKLQKL